MDKTETLEAPPPQASAPKTPHQVFRTETGQVLNKAATEAYTARRVDESPNDFNPTNDQILAVLDNLREKPIRLERKSAEPQNHVAYPEPTTPPAEPNTDLADKIRSILNQETQAENPDPQTLLADTQELTREVSKLAEGKNLTMPAVRRMLLRLTPVILGLAALLPQEANTRPIPQGPPETPPPKAAPISRVDEAPAVAIPEFENYTVEAGDSISGILAKRHPETWLDENGMFKVDDDSQNLLYTQVGGIIEKNLDLIKSRNPMLIALLDQKKQDFGRPLTGPEIRDSVREVGGLNQLVLIQPGDQLTLPK